MNRLVFASTLSIRREDGTAEPNQSLDRLPFKPDFAALLLEFARTQVKLEDAESDQTRGWHDWSHCINAATVQSLTPQSSGPRVSKLPDREAPPSRRPLGLATHLLRLQLDSRACDGCHPCG